MDPVSCRTPECIPAFSGGVEDKYGKTITNENNGLLSYFSYGSSFYIGGSIPPEGGNIDGFTDRQRIC
jgi:hypothetical protein